MVEYYFWGPFEGRVVGIEKGELEQKGAKRIKIFLLESLQSESLSITFALPIR